jgi:hypothetical protein
MENLVEFYWRWYRKVLMEHVNNAHTAMSSILNSLPANKEGIINFTTTTGKGLQASFFRRIANVYAAWERSILGDMHLMSWKPTSRAWERSLGLYPHRAGEFLLRLRVQLLNITNVIDALIHERETLSEGFIKVPRIFTGNTPYERWLKRQEKTKPRLSSLPRVKILPRSRTPTKAATAIIEKAFLENILHGLEGLARNHANMVYDSATGTTMKQAIQQTIDMFSKQKIPTRQQLLSLQTHVRSFIRRVVTSPEFRTQIQTNLYLQVPPCRPVDMYESPSDSVLQRAFRVDSLSNILIDSKGSGDSLGRYPGDKIQLFPVLQKDRDVIVNASNIERTRWFLKLIKAGTVLPNVVVSKLVKDGLVSSTQAGIKITPLGEKFLRS